MNTNEHEKKIKAWVAVDRNGNENIFDCLPERLYHQEWWGIDKSWNNIVELPKGTIRHLIGKDLTWQDDPVEWIDI
jgi:hypothetical protein